MQSGENEPSPWSVNTPPKLTGGLRKRGEPGGTVLRKGFLFECLVFTRRLWNSEFFATACLKEKVFQICQWTNTDIPPIPLI